MISSFLDGLNDAVQFQIPFLLILQSTQLKRKILYSSTLNGLLFLLSHLFYLYIVRHLIPSAFVDSVYVYCYLLPIYLRSSFLNMFLYADIANEGFKLSRQTNALIKSKQCLMEMITDNLCKSMLCVAMMLQSTVLFQIFPKILGFPFYWIHTSLLFSLTSFDYKLSHLPINKRILFYEQNLLYFSGFGIIPTLVSCLFPPIIESANLGFFIPFGILMSIPARPRPSVDQYRIPIFYPSEKILYFFLKTLKIVLVDRKRK
jgi:Etoposide-induced protein 2.4 (EI24)